MRLGLLYALGPDDFAAGDSYEQALRQIEEADRLGLDSVLFEEHHGARGCPAPGSLVAAAAARTSTIRVGVANRQLTLEFPTNVAEDFAVADIISRGRVILGVTPGEEPEAFRAAGIDWESREPRFREAVELVRALWTQCGVQFIGEHYRFPLGAEGEPGWRREPFEPPYVVQWRRGQVRPQYLPMLPKPVQLPHPPIWVRAHDRETIEWAARRGLTYLCSPLENEDEVRERCGWFGAALEAAGRDRNELDLALARDVFLAEDGEEAREKALPSLRRHVDALRAESNPTRADLAIAKGASEEELLESCFLVGNPDEVIERLVALRAELGITHLVCRVHLPGRDHLDVVECIRLLASRVHTRLLA